MYGEQQDVRTYIRISTAEGALSDNSVVCIYLPVCQAVRGCTCMYIYVCIYSNLVGFFLFLVRNVLDTRPTAYCMPAESTRSKVCVKPAGITGIVVGNYTWLASPGARRVLCRCERLLFLTNVVLFVSGD